MAENEITHPLLDSWMRRLKADNKRPNTLLAYRSTVANFLRWSEAAKRPPPEYAARADVVEWLATLHERGLSAYTVASWQVRLHVFFEWLVAEGEREHNPLTGVARPRRDEVRKDVVSPDNMRRVLSSLRHDERWRDLAFVSLLYDTGMRITETVSARTADCDLDELRLFVPSGDEKGRRGRYVFFSAECAAALDRWWRCRARQRMGGQEYVLSGRQGQLSMNWGTQLIAKIFREHSVPGRISAHDLRHTSASHAWLSGMSESWMMSQYGWRDPAMVRRYSAQTQVEKARKEHAEHSPLKNLGKRP